MPPSLATGCSPNTWAPSRLLSLYLLLRPSPLMDFLVVRELLPSVSGCRVSGGAFWPPKSSRGKLLQEVTDSWAGWVAVSRRHEANCPMMIWELSGSLCCHPVSLPGSPPGLAQCWETGLGKCPVVMVLETYKGLAWGGYARSFTTGGEEAMFPLSPLKNQGSFSTLP